MAIVEIPKRETLPKTPKKALSNLFSLSRTSSISIPPLSPSPPATTSPPRSVLEETVEKVAPTITKTAHIFLENRKHGEEFINSVTELRRSMNFAVSEGFSGSEKLVVAQNLMKIAMERLEKEFYRILSDNRECLDPESVSSRSSQNSRSTESGGSDSSEVDAMSALKSIADCMISSGYGKECFKTYIIIRKSIVEEGMYRLGIHRKYGFSQINKLDFDGLDRQIKTWLSAVKIAVKSIFSGERFLCDHVFSASERIRDLCFSDVSKEEAKNLYRFPEFVAKTKRSPEKIFRLMDLYESISELLPEIETIFSYESLSEIKLQALTALHKLGDSVRTNLSEYESSIRKQPFRTPVPGGGIHPLSESVMNYVSTLADYNGILGEIVVDSPYPESVPESYSPETPLSRRLAWIVLVLLCKLDRNAELYNDIALSYLFLANNFIFIVERVNSTGLKVLLGDQWITDHDRKAKLYTANYESTAWKKVFGFLQENPATSPESGELWFRRFNSVFEEACRRQKSWVVPDGRMRDEIKVSIARKLVPAYRELYGKYVKVIGKEKNMEVLVRYSPDNLGNYLSDLFHGNETSGSFSLSSSSSVSSSCTSRCLI